MLRKILITLATSAVVLAPFSAKASEDDTKIPLVTRISQISPYVQDVQGWNGTTWGMTKDEVLKIFPTLEIKDDRWLKGTYTLDKIPCNLSFRFELGKLTGVFLTVKGKGYEDAAFSFNGLLRDKYGPPTKTGGLTGTRDVVWVLTSTEVELHVRTISKDEDQHLTMLAFSKREKRNDI